MDNEIVGSWGAVLAEGDKPIVSVNRVNDKIRFLNIYAAGAFKPKISIERGKKRARKSKYTIEFLTAVGTLEPLNYYQKELYLESAHSN